MSRRMQEVRASVPMLHAHENTVGGERKEHASMHGHAMPLFFTFSHTNRKSCLHGSHQGSLLLVRLDAAAALRHLEHHHGSSSSRRHLHAHADYGQRSMYSAGSSALRL